MLDENDVLRSTAPISSAMDTSRCRNSSSSIGSCRFMFCERSFFTSCDVYQECRDLLPAAIFRFLDYKAVSGGFGANAHRSRGGRLGLGGSIGRGPGLAAIVRDVCFVLARIQSGVDPQRSVRGRFEVKALNRGHAAFFKDGPLAPGFAAVRCDKKKRIARRGLQIGAGN